MLEILSSDATDEMGCTFAPLIVSGIIGNIDRLVAVNTHIAL